MSFDRNNCALGEKCECSWPGGLVKNTEYWKCANWGRSTLSAPRIGHTESHYTGQSRADIMSKLDDRKRKMDKYNKATDDRLREVRHADPVRHLAKKGVKVNR
jgi:hypothetical protein